MRVALEQTEPERDMENFVRDYGTGNAIPDPPSFVNYNNAEAVPSGSARITSRPAQFPRSSQRQLPLKQPPPPVEDEPFVNTAGVGAGSRRGTADTFGDVQPLSRSQTQSRASTRGQAQTNGIGSAAPNGAGSTQQLNRHPTAKSHGDFHSDPIDPTAETMLKVGNQAYKVDPSKDPQQQPTNGRPTATPAQNGNVGDPNDPLAQRMAELNKAVSSEGSNGRRNSTYRPTHSPSDSRSGKGSITRKNTTGAGLSPPSSTSNPAASSRDYRNSAEVVVGAYPGSTSRPSSPNPPTASFMAPPKQSESDQPVNAALADYQLSLPGERKPSRSDSRRNSFTGPPAPTHSQNQSQGHNLARPVSREGHVGIGAHGGRSRSTSPAPQQQGPSTNRRNSFISGAGSVTSPGSSVAGHATSPPNSVGISLDPSGKVAHDSMADSFRQRQPQQQQQPSYSQPPSVTRNPTQRLSGFGANNNGMAPPPQSQPAYAAPPPPPSGYTQPPQQQPSYSQPAPVRQAQYNQQPSYTQPPPTHYPPPAPQQPVYQPQPQGGGYSGPGMNGDLSSIQGPYSSGSHLAAAAHPYAVGGRTPSPQPPPPPQSLPPAGFTEDGRAVLFYGEESVYSYH